MCELLVNDIFDQLREDNQRLKNELSFERDLNKILENIKTLSIIMKSNCICSENIEYFKKINDLEIDYKILKSKRKDIENGIKKMVYHESAQIDLNLSGTSSGIEISNIKSLLKTDNESPKKSKRRSSVSESILPNLEVVHSCNECHQRFESELDLVVHVNRAHKDVESFVCHECNQVFNTKDLFSNHLSEHQSSGKTTPSTSKPKIRITDYLRSYRKPNPSETIPIENIKTENKFEPKYITEMLRQNNSYEQMDSTSNILSNSLKVESNSDGIECKECLNTFKNVKGITSHIFQKHPCLVCGKCKKWFYTKEEVFAHLSTEHKVNGQKQLYVCEPCNYRTLIIGHFKEHRRSKRCQTNHLTCKTCTITFTTTHDLRAHTCNPGQPTINQSSSTSAPKRRVVPINGRKINGYFHCNSCNFKSKRGGNLNQHQIVHSNARPFKCGIKGCQLRYKSNKDLTKHRNRIHNKIQINLLKELNANIRSSSKLDFSQESKGNSIEDQINPELNINSDAIESKIKLEVISDSDDESVILKSSAERILDLTHNESKESQDVNLSCKLCHYTTDKRISLALHEMLEHPELRPHKCTVDDCGKAFRRADTLTRHKKAMHSTGDKMNQLSTTTGHSRVFECNSCNYKTQMESLLRRHLLTHSPNKPFKCDVEGCHYSAQIKSNLRKHQKRIHMRTGNQFICNYPNCKRGFETPLLLRGHMNSHKNRFLCRWEGCEYRTDTFAKLNEHKRNENHLKTDSL